MPPRKTPPLAYCEYVTPTARLNLMEAVKRVYPTMLERLSANVFPEYVALAKAGFDFDAILWNPRRSPSTELAAIDLASIAHQLTFRMAEPSDRGAGHKSTSSDHQIEVAIREGDFRTYQRLMNEKCAADHKHRRFPPNVKAETVLQKCEALRNALRSWATEFNADIPGSWMRRCGLCEGGTWLRIGETR